MIDNATTQANPASPNLFLWKLILGAFFVNLFVVLLVSLALRQSRLHYEQGVAISTQNLSYTLEQYIADTIGKIDLALLAVADEVGRQNTRNGIDRKATNAYIARIFSRLPFLHSLRMANAQGEILCGIDTEGKVTKPAVRVADRDYFKRVEMDLNAGLVISEPVLSRVSGKWVIIFARRLNRPDGSFNGAVWAGIELEYLNKTFAKIDVGQYGAVILRDSEMGLIARYPALKGGDSSVGQRQVSKELLERTKTGKTAGTYYAARTTDNIPRILSFRKIDNYPLYLIVGQATSEYLAPWRKEVLGLASLTAIFTLITILSSWLFYRDTTQRRLAEEKVYKSEALLKEAQQIAHIGSWELDIMNNRLDGSDEAHRIFEMDRERLGASFEAFLSIVHPDDRDLVNAAYADSLKNRAPAEVTHRLLMPDGRVKQVSESFKTFYDTRGNPVRSVGTLQDITERVRAEEALRRSEEAVRIRERMLNDSQRVGQVGGWDWDAVHDVIWWSDEYYRIYGFEPGTPPPNYAEHLKVYTPESAVLLDAAVKRAMEQGEPYELDLELANPTPTTRWIAARGEVKRDEAGKICGLRGTAQNITERKRAEENVRRLNERFVLAADAAGLGVWDWDVRKNELVWDDRMYKLYGVRKQDFTGAYEAWLKGLHPDDRARSDEISEQARRGEREYDTEFRVVWPDGSIHYLKAYGRVVRDVNGGPLRMTGVNFDITERKQAEEELRASTQRLNLHFQQTPLGVIEWNLNFEVTTWNSAAESIFGYRRDEAMGAHASLIVPASAKEHVDRVWSDLVGKKGGTRSTNENITKDGRTIYCEWYNTPLVDESGTVVGVASLVQDVTDRKAAEEALRKSQAFVKNILESVDEGFIVVDREYRIVSANRAFFRIASEPESNVMGRFCYSVSHKLVRPCFETGEECAVKRTFETGNSHVVTHIHVDAAGAKHHVEIKSYPITDASGTVVSAIETINDITEKKRLEEQLRQAQKMEAIGTLAGGVAHDFNNILTAIMGYSNIVKRKMQPDDPQRASIDQILMASDRAAHLTRGLLAFSRKQVINPRPVDLNDIVKSVEKLLRRLIGEDIEFITPIASTSLIVMADAGQIEQVLMNLATNARDAMPEGGILTITTEEIAIREDFISVHGYGRSGRYALITVSDTGVGMNEQTREKIFEPFFTTKELGRGTGLGLAIVYGIVKQHDGIINVYSEPGKGTTFKLYFPLIAAAVEERKSEPSTLPKGGTETVLLAEDDQTVRAMTTSVLREFGYRVIEAVDGQDALEKYAANAGEIQLLLLDVVMPRKSGKEVYDAVKAMRHDIRALFMSGYTADIINKKGIFEEGLQLITKPVSPFELLGKVRELLDKGK